MRPKLLPLIKSFLLVIAIMVMSILGSGELLGGASPTSLDTTASTSIPTIAYTSGGQQVQAPDWAKITFSSLPPIESPGWIDFQPSLIKSLGYDPSRVWFAGSSPTQFVMLGDMAEAFHMEAFNLKDISGLTGLAIESLTLNDFGLTQWQTPKSLVKAIPQLGKLSISQITPLQDLIELGGGGSGSIANAIRTNPTFANSPLVKLDLNKYSLGSIPGLTQTPIAKFAGWQQSFIAQVPGLSFVPFDRLPLPLLGGSIRIGTTDLVWSGAEHGDGSVPPDLYISGTVNKKSKTVPVPCKPNQPCAYIELSDPLGTNAPLHGKRWVSGKIQKVKGGFGPLAKVNDGWEPAGKLVFGSAFKVVLTDTDESQGLANFALYLRACVNIPFYGKSCTPYFIGGIPWLPTEETGFVIVASTAKPNVNVDSKYQQQIASIEQSNQPQTSNPQSEQSNQQAGDSAASQYASPTDGIKSANARIMAAINNLGGFPSNAPGTDGGENACMWAVNRVIKEAGLEPLGNDTLAVRRGQADLDRGRGQKINIANAQPGDIVLVDLGGSKQHIGFCLNSGCTQTISNSSSRASFTFRGNSNFSYPGSPYNGATPQVYRLKK